MSELIRIFDRERETIQNMLQANAQEPERCCTQLERSLDRILLSFNETCLEEAVQTECARMMQVLHAALPLITCQGEATVWSRTGSSSNEKSNAGKGGEKRSLLARFLLLAGILCLAGSVFLTLGTVRIGPGLMKLLPAVLCAAAGSVLLFFAGTKWRDSRSARGAETQLVRVSLDPDHIMHTLRTVFLLMDRELDGIAKAQNTSEIRARGSRDNDAASLSDQELDLICSLLEAGASGNGDFALERLADLNTFLYRQGIDVVSYTPECAAWFEMMPGMRQMTIRPALAKNGTLLRKGRATGGLE